MNLVEKPDLLVVQSELNTNRFNFRRIIKILMWLLVPLAVWWSLKDIPLSEISKNLRQIGLPAVLILIGINVFIFILFSFRWWMIMRAQGWRISLLSVIGYRLAGFGITYFTPGPQFGGEPAQVYLLKVKEGIPLSPAVTSVAVDKLLELLANFSFLLVGVSVIILSGVMKSADTLPLILFPILLLTFPVIYLLALRTDHLPVTYLLGKTSKFKSMGTKHPGRINMIRETESQVAIFCQRNVIVLLAGAFLSVVIWVLMVLEFGLMMNYLGVQFNLVQVLIALTAARIAFLLPLPAGLGTLEAGQVMAMGLIGVNPVIGISLSLLIRARDILFGSAGLWVGGHFSR
jgi:uncharacterized protein (TIRG00374 family)